MEDYEDFEEERSHEDECLVCSRADVDLVVDGYCRHCAVVNGYEECFECGAWTDDSETFNYRNYCLSCFENLFDTCYGCGDVCRRDELSLNNEGEVLCDSCWREGRPRDNGLYSHDYKPSPAFHGLGNLYFGIELETECHHCQQHDAVNVLSSLSGDLNHTELEKLFYCKEDSSLDNGVEFVSHPMTWDVISSQKYQDMFAALLAKLREIGCRSWKSGNCGMHVHMSRSAFSKLHLFKYMAFISYAKPLVELIAQRESNTFAQNRLLNSKQLCDKVKVCRSLHFDALSIAHTTIELRIFRGNLKIDMFLKNLEFCKALYDFTLVEPLKSFTNKEGLSNKFLLFVQQHKRMFSNLSKFLERELLEKHNATTTDISATI